MKNSILLSVKKSLGITEEEKGFDDELIIHINSILSTLNQIGIGPIKGLRITGSAESWEDLTEGRTDMEFVKDYVALRTRVMFDPPTSSNMMEAINKSIAEFEWRLSIMPGKE